jgi:hypothetical protein
MSTGFWTEASGTSSLRSVDFVRSESGAISSPERTSASVARIAGPAGVGEHGDALAARQRHLRERQADVEQLLDRIDALHAAVLE